MTLAVGVKFRRHGPLNYYAPGELEPQLVPGARVLAETARGVEIGEVVMEPCDVDPRVCPEPMPEVLRLASPEDLKMRAERDLRLPEAMRIARELVAERKLSIKVSRAEISFDGTRILFDFTAERQSDYQELARELAARLRCRIELRQVGARDEAKVQDGYGPCGRRLCCSSWLKEFVPVTIKMAKEQGLPLNPTRLNGMCGKLKCCLQYENEQYVDFRRSLPQLGSELDLNGQPVVVQELSMVREQVLVSVTGQGTVEAVPAEQLVGQGAPSGEAPRRRRRRPREQTPPA